MRRRDGGPVPVGVSPPAAAASPLLLLLLSLLLRLFLPPRPHQRGETQPLPQGPLELGRRRGGEDGETRLLP